MRGIEVSETVCGLIYRTRLAEVDWEALAVVGLILSGNLHVGLRYIPTSDRLNLSMLL